MYSLVVIYNNSEFPVGRFSSWKDADVYARQWCFSHYRIYIYNCGVMRLVKEVKEGVVLHE